MFHSDEGPNARNVRLYYPYQLQYTNLFLYFALYIMSFDYNVRDTYLTANKRIQTPLQPLIKHQDLNMALLYYDINRQQLIPILLVDTGN